MRNKIYQKLTVFTASILIVQVFSSTTFSLLPVTADTIDTQEKVSETTNPSESSPEITIDEVPDVVETEETAQNLLGDDPISFNFTQSYVQGKVGELITITIEANQETDEFLIKLPQEATISKVTLPSVASIEETVHKNIWYIRLSQPQKVLSLNLAFEDIGFFEAQINDSKIAIDVIEPEEYFISNEEDGERQMEIGPVIASTLEAQNPSDRTNFLQNPNFTFGIEDERIPNWEISSAEAIVNFVNRDVALTPLPEGEDRYGLVGFPAMSVGRAEDELIVRQERNNGSLRRTFMISQTIDTIPNKTYRMGISARSIDPDQDALLTLVAYHGMGNPPAISGNGALGTSGALLLTPDYNEYELTFQATRERSSISFRVVGDEVSIKNAFVQDKEYSLSLEATPAYGGNPSVDRLELAEGETTLLNANPNQGYRFARWDIIYGIGSDVSDPTDPNATFIMGSQDTLIQAIYQTEESGKVYIQHLDTDGNELAETESITGLVGEIYETHALEIEHYNLVKTPENASGIFEENLIFVTYIYDLESTTPLDPLFPDQSIDPENKPNLPVDQGLFSIDFASQIRFGKNRLSLTESFYEAAPQRILNEDGSINEQEVRPNYVQISDRRSNNDRTNWQLSVRQSEGFFTDSGEELLGAQVRFENQKLTSAKGNVSEELQPDHTTTLIPGERQVLFEIPEDEDSDTWFYLLGDENTAGNSVILDIPMGSNPQAENYTTRFTWEISTVPSR